MTEQRHPRKTWIRVWIAAFFGVAPATVSSWRRRGWLRSYAPEDVRAFALGRGSFTVRRADPRC